MSDVNTMPIPQTLPVMVLLVKDWLGTDPQKVESLYGQVRWTWTVDKATFDADFEPKWIAHEKEMKNVPAWFRGVQCISVLWPSENRLIVNVILRDASIDFWCLPANVRANHPVYKSLYCNECKMVRDHCKCSH